MADVIRITTTAEKAQALADAIRHPLNARKADTTLAPLVAEALTEVEEALGQPERKRRYAQTLWDMGMPHAQAPERDTDGPADYSEKHPSYALIGVNRVQSSGAALAGTDFVHRQYVKITLKRARLSRSLSGDHWFGDDQIVEVNLSEAQWATFVSAFGVGDGVPCTLAWTETDGHVPGIVSITDRREQVSGEVRRTLSEAAELLDDILSDPKITRATREKAERAKMRLTSSVPFVVEQADKHMEKTIEHAKIEVSAYANAAVRAAGLAALAGQEPVALITAGDES